MNYSRQTVLSWEDLEARMLELGGALIDEIDNGDEDIPTEVRTNMLRAALSPEDFEEFMELERVVEDPREQEPYFVADSYFEEYTKEQVDDRYRLPPSWVVIDWEATAKNVQVDYAYVEFGGKGWWYRE